MKEPAVIKILTKLLIFFFFQLHECFRSYEKTLRFPETKSLSTGKN